MSKIAKRKSWVKMTAAELVEATKQFDKPIPLSRTRPLSPRNRARWKRAQKSKPDVSIFVDGGHAEVLVHLDEDLLARARDYAKKNKTSLPKMIDRGLRGLLAFAG
jgi:hypothetical protein